MYCCVLWKNIVFISPCDVNRAEFAMILLANDTSTAILLETVETMFMEYRSAKYMISEYHVAKCWSPNYMNPGYFTLAAIDLKP